MNWLHTVKFTSAALVANCILHAPASAAVVTLEMGSPIFGSLGSDVVRISYADNTPPAGGAPGNPGSGNFNGNGGAGNPGNGNGGPPANPGNGLGGPPGNPGNGNAGNGIANGNGGAGNSGNGNDGLSANLGDSSAGDGPDQPAEVTVDTNAGRFEAEIQSYSGISLEEFVGTGNDIYAYCYEIYENVSGGQLVTYDINFEGAQQRTLQFLGAVNYVLHGGSNDWADPYAWVFPVSGNIGAAIQLGIWESLYDTGWTISSGSFRVTDSTLANQTRDFLQQVFDAIDLADSLDRQYTMVLEAPGVQNLITARTVTPPSVQVSEPAGLMLVGLGLLGLVGLRRKHSPTV